jgi:hypothetical protein
MCIIHVAHAIQAFIILFIKMFKPKDLYLNLKYYKHIFGSFGIFVSL